MKEMQRVPVALYPFSRELIPVVMFFEKLQEKYKLSRLIAPSGCAAIGRDAGTLNNGPVVGTTVEDTLGENSNSWQVLILVVNPKENDAIRQQGLQYAQKAIDANKTVFLAGSLDSIDDKLLKLYEENRELVRIYSHYSPDTQIKIDSRTIYDIDTPIMLVGGVVEQADVLAIILQLYLHLKDEGQTPLVLTKQAIGAFLGFNSVYAIYETPQLSESEKIIEINHAIANIVSMIQPDIVLIEAPDALMRFNDFAPNGFGIRTYMLSQAVKFDSLVCGISCEMANNEFVKLLSDDFEVRYRCPITAVHASNVLIDSISTRTDNKPVVFFTSQEDVSRYIAEWNIDDRPPKIPIFNAVGDDFINLYKYLFVNENLPTKCLESSHLSDNVDQKLTWILREKFHFSQEMLSPEKWTLPLTGADFNMEYYDLLYLLFEVEKKFDILIDTKHLRDYGFNSIQSIIAIINSLLNSEN